VNAGEETLNDPTRDQLNPPKLSDHERVEQISTLSPRLDQTLLSKDSGFLKQLLQRQLAIIVILLPKDR
jgi:hypothetical protein